MAVSRSLQLDQSAGAVTILRRAVGLLPRVPSVLGIYVVVAILSLLSNVLGNFASIVGQSVAVVLVYREIGGEADANNSLGVRLLIAMFAALVAGFGIVVGLALLIVPGIYLLIRLRLAVAAVMLEDSGPIEALGRSFDLTNGHGWTVFGIWLIPFVISLPVGGIVVVAAGGVSLSGAVNSAALQPSLRLAAAASIVVTGPLVATSDAILYGLYGPDALGDGNRRASDTVDEADGYEY